LRYYQHEAVRVIQRVVAASLGAWDIIGIGSTDVVLAQVKTRDWPGSVEMETR
jgi:hypothetical protein